jgi:hypothetical protein
VVDANESSLIQRSRQLGSQPPRDGLEPDTRQLSTAAWSRAERVRAQLRVRCCRRPRQSDQRGNHPQPIAPAYDAHQPAIADDRQTLPCLANHPSHQARQRLVGGYRFDRRAHDLAGCRLPGVGPHQGLLYGRVRADLAATSGLHTGEDVLKLLAVGAAVTMWRPSSSCAALKPAFPLLSCAWTPTRTGGDDCPSGCGPGRAGRQRWRQPPIGSACPPPPDLRWVGSIACPPPPLTTAF